MLFTTEFVFRIDYTWKAEGAAQEGFLVIGSKTTKTEVFAVRFDSWHTPNDYMTFQGYVKDSVIVLNGSYPISEGPDWEWRIVIDFSSPDSLEILMFNITPEGLEGKAVEVNYQRI